MSNFAKMLQKAADRQGLSHAPERDASDDPRAELGAECRALLSEFYEQMPTSVGKHASRKERDDRGLKMSSLVYGEVRAARARRAISLSLSLSFARATRRDERDLALLARKVSFDSIAIAFAKIRTTYASPGGGGDGAYFDLSAPGGVFYDLGSGSGKPTIAARNK